MQLLLPMKSRVFPNILLLIHVIIGGYCSFWMLRNVAVVDGTPNWLLGGEPVIYLAAKNKLMKLFVIGVGGALVVQAALVFLFARDRFAEAFLGGRLLKQIIAALLPCIVLLGPSRAAKRPRQ